jgi:predicted nucleic acid-binding protein
LTDRGADPKLTSATAAISDTGPVISAFQSDSLGVLLHIFAAIYVPPACLAELNQHGWRSEVGAASPFLVPVVLTETEEKRAEEFAGQVAARSRPAQRVAAYHRGEAQAIVLALRPEFRRDMLLIDERAARDVAIAAGLTITGFPGVLLLAA